LLNPYLSKYELIYDNVTSELISFTVDLSEPFDDIIYIAAYT